MLRIILYGMVLSFIYSTASWKVYAIRPILRLAFNFFFFFFNDTATTEIYTLSLHDALPISDLEIAAGVPHILGRAYLLEQVIVNLVLNAVDAASGGLVVLGARPWAYEPGRAAPKRATDAGRTAFPRGYERRPARVEFAAGQAGALLLVADSGPGVAAEDRDKIFEPFYTTKEPGAAPGLLGRV